MKVKFSKEEIREVSKKILVKIAKMKSEKAKILAFSGDLGAGKTTLTQELGKILEIKEKIISPTFVIMKIYKVSPKSEYYSHFKKLVHIDAYRLDSHEELLKIGWEKLEGDKDNLIIIEWPERVRGIIPPDNLHISLSHIDEENREIEFCFN